jgi:hypothetical protein
MTLISISVVALALTAVVWGFVRQRALGRARIEALGPGAIVFVRTPDRQRLLARVISRGPSHFWIELAPGDARWWVPATAVEPAPECSREIGWFKTSTGAPPRETH